MAKDISSSVSELHRSPWRLVAACTGAGTGLAEALWREPGSSGTMLEMIVPCSRSSLTDFIGREPTEFVSAETARLMAAAAYSRAMELSLRDELPTGHLLGLGLTATVATDRPKGGAHRLHLAAKTSQQLFILDYVFQKDGLPREIEGQARDRLALNLILHVAGLLESDEINIPGWSGYRLSRQSLFSPEPSTSLSEEALIEISGKQEPVSGLNRARHVLFPGSFNPVHYGHERVAAAAAQLTGKTVVFHLAADHPTKGCVSKEEILHRASQFAYRHPVLLTGRDGLYIDKCRRFPGFDILIGAGAVLALLNPKYYGGSIWARDDMLEEIVRLGNRFLVSGRVVNGQYLDPTCLPIPDAFHWLFVPVSGGLVANSNIFRNRASGR